MLHSYFLNDFAYCEQKAAGLGLPAVALAENAGLIAAAEALNDGQWYAPVVPVPIGSRSTVAVTVYHGRSEAVVEPGAVLVELAKEDVSRADSVLDLVIESLAERVHDVNWWLPRAASDVLGLHEDQLDALVKETVINNPRGRGKAVYLSIYGY